MGRALKMHDVYPQDRAALYHVEPPLMGYEWVIACRGPGVWDGCVELVGASVRGDRLETLRDVWGAKDHAEAFRTYGYEVVGLPKEGER